MTRLAGLPLGLYAAATYLGWSSSAVALIKFNDGHDEIFVTATAGIAYDSNIFASAGSDGDTSFTSSLLLEYRRHAGMLGVNGEIAWNFSKFSTFSEEDFANPRFKAELTKNSGRTTGSASISAEKENRADTAINVRTESWNYASEVVARYPVIERYSFGANLGWDRRDFQDNAQLVDINTYRGALNLFYALNSERDLTAGYRYRTTNTTADTKDTDHGFDVGVDGKIIPKLNGSARVGLQNRNVDRQGLADTSHTSLTASVAATWSLTSRASLAADVEKDFGTLATDESVDTTAASLNAQYAVNSKTSAFASVGYGHVRFIEALRGNRTDDYVSFNLGLSYTFHERLRITASYGYFQNWSTLELSDFERHSFSLNLSSRW